MKRERRHLPKVGKRAREGLVSRKSITYEESITPEEAEELNSRDDFDRLADSIQQWAHQALADAGLPTEEGLYVVWGDEWEAIPEGQTDAVALERAHEVGGKLANLHGLIEALTEELSPPWRAGQALHWLAEAQNPEAGPRYAAVAGMRAMHHMHTGIFRQRYEENAMVGGGVLASAAQGHEAVHGSPRDKRERWGRYQEQVEEKMGRNPRLKITDARRQVARDYGVSLKTVTRHTVDPTKK